MSLYKKIFGAIYITLFIVTIAFAGSITFQSITSIIKHYKTQIITTGDLDEDAREYFVSGGKKGNPGIVKLDFNGDGIQDLAILTKYSLKIFTCTKQCTELKNISYGGFYGIQSIILVKKGQVIEEAGSIADERGPIKIKLVNDAIMLCIYGKASVVFYWDPRKKRVESITTSD